MRYRFRIIYQNEYMKKSCELMRKMDLDIGEVGLEQVITFIAKEQEIQVLKDNIIKAFESENVKVLYIEGGKVE